MRRGFVTVLASILTLVLAFPLVAAENAGVSMSDTVVVGSEKLILNGMGLRKKAIFKVYVAGLYLEEKQSDPAAILAADEKRSLIMHFVRNVGADSICGGWDDGLENNTAGASAEVKKQFATLCTWMEDVSDGDRLVFTYVPGEGTEVTVKESSKGKLEGKAFADALFACWLGSSPPSADFKKGLLKG
ncbi:MAG: chalcone isomerase family protein [Deltaproteobacteria bacterium]|nr:chalcone isomerase family protein [Deltaproteobacteria bacterium]